MRTRIQHISSLFIFWFCLAIMPEGMTQNYEMDTAYINARVKEIDTTLKNSPEESIEALEEILQLSKEIDYPQGIMLSEIGMARNFFAIGNPQESYKHLDTALQLATALDDMAMKIKITMSRVRLDLATRDREKALSGLEEIREDIFESTDTSNMINWYCLKARAMDGKSDFASAMQLIERARMLNEDFGSRSLEAVIQYTTGGLFFTMGNFEKARYYFQNAIDYYEQKNELTLLLTLYTNMMAAWQAEKNYDKAMEYLSKKQTIQEELGSEVGILTTAENKAHLLVDMGKFEEARKQTEYTLQLCRKFQMDSTHSLYWMGIVYRGLDRYDIAAEYMKQAFALALDTKNYGKATFYAHALYQTYYWKKKYFEALTWYQSHIQFRDSIYSERQQKEIQVYTARFEAAERAKEIMELEKEAEIEKLKRNRIFGILTSGLIIGLMTIVFLIYRNRRNREKLRTEKALAESKRKEAELKHDLLQKEFDLKQQELASGMLQIARKNEFLISLKDQMEVEPNKTQQSKYLLKQIQNEINSEEDWDKFISSFRDVHPSYMMKLSDISTAGLSKSETKLACLLKMNLSSKDIANMLNISSEGIKKARYRLRKKLGLETDVDLHEFLMGLG